MPDLASLSLTVDALGVSEGLVLLSLVPFNDQSVTEGQSRSGVRSTVQHRSAAVQLVFHILLANVQLIAVEQRSGKRCLNVLHHLMLELFSGRELSCGL